jgi:transcriptional regulator with XRE-family HTH domain
MYNTDELFSNDIFETIRFFLHAKGLNNIESLVTFDFDTLYLVPGISEELINQAKNQYNQYISGDIKEMIETPSAIVDSPLVIQPNTPKNTSENPDDISELCIECDSIAMENNIEKKRDDSIIICKEDTDVHATKISSDEDIQQITEDDVLTELEEDSQDCTAIQNLAVDINETGLSVRAKNALKRSDIHYVQDLLQISNETLLGIRNIGVKTLQEIIDFKNGIDVFLEAQDKKKKIEDNAPQKVIGSNAPIEDAAFSVRTYNALRRHGTFTISQLFEMDDLELLQIQNLGRKSVDEIIHFRNKYSIPTKAEYNHDDLIINSIDSSNLDISIELIARVFPNLLIPTDKLKYVKDIVGVELIPSIYYSARSTAEFLSEPISTRFEEQLLKLKGKAYQIILRREKGETLQEIGDDFGITRERVRQLESKAVRGLIHFANLVASSLISESKPYFNYSEIQAQFENEASAICCIHVLRESEYVIHFIEMEKFIHKEICPKNPESILQSTLSEIIGDGVNYTEKIETIEDELSRLEMNFFNADEIAEYIVHCGYRFYGEFVSHGRKKYVDACIFVINKYFPFDIKLDSDSDNEDMQRLRALILRDFRGIVLPEDNRAITSRITSYVDRLVLCGRGRYCPIDRVVYDSKLINEIVTMIFDSGQSSFYFNELFEMYKGRLLSTSNIDNPHFLHGVIKLMYTEEFHYERVMLTKKGETRENFDNRLTSLLIESGKPISKMEIKKSIPGTRDFMIAFANMRQKEIIQWDFNELNYIHNVVSSEIDIDSIRNVIAGEIEKHDGYTSEQLIFSRMLIENHQYLQRNMISCPQNLFYISEYYFGDEYRFRRPHIVTKEIPIDSVSTVSIAQYFLGAKDRISFESFNDLADRLGWADGTRYQSFSEIEKSYVRINIDEYVERDRLVLPEGFLFSLNSFLGKLVSVNGFTAINGIFDFDKFPSFDFEWNGFLLESIIDNFDTNYKMINQQVKDRRYQRGLVVPRQSDFDSFDQLVAEVLKQDGIGSISLAGMLNQLKLRGIVTRNVPQDLFESDYMKYKNEYFILI